MAVCPSKDLLKNLRNPQARRRGKKPPEGAAFRRYVTVRRGGSAALPGGHSAARCGACGLGLRRKFRMPAERRPAEGFPVGRGLCLSCGHGCASFCDILCGRREKRQQVFAPAAKKAAGTDEISTDVDFRRKTAILVPKRGHPRERSERRGGTARRRRAGPAPPARPASPRRGCRPCLRRLRRSSAYPRRYG